MEKSYNIRECTEAGKDMIVDIWYRASVVSHKFFSEFYWEEHISDIKDIYIPAGKTYIYGSGYRVLGFISMMDNVVVPFFADPCHQQQDIGKLLIGYVKGVYSVLQLTVYTLNGGSVSFYGKQSFFVKEEQSDTETNFQQFIMQFG